MIAFAVKLKLDWMFLNVTMFLQIPQPYKFPDLIHMTDSLQCLSTPIVLPSAELTVWIASILSNEGGWVSHTGVRLEIVNTLRLRQNDHSFADDIFKCISINENFWILNKISLKSIL